MGIEASASAPSLTGWCTNPCAPEKKIGAVLFDLDGTLYLQPPMRRKMAAELAALAVRRPFSAPRTLRVLRAYRHAQEALRDTPNGAANGRQLAWAVEHAGARRDEAAAIVEEWMFERPLKHMRDCLAPGIETLLDWLSTHSIALGVLSDYRAEEKLAALGLAGRFSTVISADDPAVGTFKPSPRGFLVACQRLGLPPASVLMVGDRVDADAAGAAAAGMPCVVVTPRAPSTRPGQDLLILPSLERLLRVLDRR